MKKIYIKTLEDLIYAAMVLGIEILTGALSKKINSDKSEEKEHK